MSTNIEYVVDVEATVDEASAIAEKVVQSLIDRGIVLSTPQTHEYLDDGPRYATGPNVEEVADFNDCIPCGLDVEIGRTVFTPGENGLTSLTCPSCKTDHGPDDVDWVSAVEAWYTGTSEAAIVCPNCSAASVITDWQFEPVWGFGNLAFKFSEWLLKDEFVEDLSRQLRHKVAWVRCRV